MRNPRYRTRGGYISRITGILIPLRGTLTQKEYQAEPDYPYLCELKLDALVNAPVFAPNLFPMKGMC